LRQTLRETCSQLRSKMECARRKLEAAEVEREHFEAAQLECEVERQGLTQQIRAKEAETTAVRARAAAVRAEGSEVFASLEAEREHKGPLLSEIATLKSKISSTQRHGESDLAVLEAQLVSAIEVQGSLRFSLLRSQAEAERACVERESMEAKVAELRSRLEEARASYLVAIDVLDRRVATLEKDGREAERTVERLERALESVSFRMRMADVELQRW